MVTVPELSDFTENLPNWQHCRPEADAKLAMQMCTAQRCEIENFQFLTLKTNDFDAILHRFQNPPAKNACKLQYIGFLQQFYICLLF